MTNLDLGIADVYAASLSEDCDCDCEEEDCPSDDSYYLSGGQCVQEVDLEDDDEDSDW